MKFTDLQKTIRCLEIKWQAKLPDSNPFPNLANGEVQFFTVEARNKNSDSDLPVVLCIGINYTQVKQCYTWHTPYLRDDSDGAPGVTSGAVPSMFNCIGATFDSYDKDKTGWQVRRLASSNTFGTPSDFILLVTNFSPLITFQPWQKYPSQYTADLLTLFNSGYEYLDDLIAKLRNEKSMPEIIVAHGLGSEVPSLFRKWQNVRNLSPWLLTANAGWQFPKGPKAFHRKEPPSVPISIGGSENGFTELPGEIT